MSGQSLGAPTSAMGLPIRPPRARFALTPLADAMFQLLIFFMLSSSLAPYSLLTLKAGATPETQASAGAGTGSEAAPTPEAEIALWTLEADTIIVGGQRFGMDRLGDLADALGTQTAPAQVVLILRPSARVQDMATVLARLQAAEVSAVRVASGGE